MARGVLMEPIIMTTMETTMGTDRLESVMRSQNRLKFFNVVFTLTTIGAVLLGALSLF